MSKHVTPDKDRVPLKEKIMYGAGSGSFQMANDGVKGLANQIFNITLHVDPLLIGFVLTFSRIVDAFTDPIMGNISDHTKSRWGRRRPYIFIGSFLVAAAFIGLWMVPETWNTHRIFIWYFWGMLLFYLCTTIQCVPYHTLGLEMTPDYHERTVVSGYKMFFSFTFMLFVPWIFRIVQADIFPSVMVGMRTISWWVAGAIIIGGLLPAIFVKERYYKIANKAVKVGFFKGMWLTMKNKSFLILTGIILTTGIGGGMVGALGNYVIYYYMFEGDTKAGSTLGAIGANVFSVAAIISIPIMTWCAGRYGKVATIKGLVVLGIVGALSKYLLYNKEWPYLLLLSQFMVAPLAAGFWTLTTSMKADICDEDELDNGARREGMFGSVGNWITKLTMSCTFILAGWILNYTGFDVNLGGGQSPETLEKMRILFSVVPATSSILAFFLLAIYPLNEKRMLEIRGELEARRGETDQDA
ncbi:MFS transporter [Cerasicoccus frondis]|uniref:MFS transporter n=1 Tax=Cerasicoccus frondis TaxID=490090 RepID=UPI002852A44B|nr:MFS transporter [Cerasicoccus frondis]